MSTCNYEKGFKQIRYYGIYAHNRKIKSMSEDDLIDMDYFLSEGEFEDDDDDGKGFYIF